MSYAEAGFPIDKTMFVHEGVLGKLSWEPSPEVIHELRMIADTSKDATTLEERVGSAAAFDALYQYATGMYLELLVLSFFGTADGKTRVHPYQLLAALQTLQNEVRQNGLVSPEMAAVIAKTAMRKADGG